MRQILLAGKEPQESPSLFGDVIANRAAKHWIPSFHRVKDGTLRHRSGDFELQLCSNVSQSPEMGWKDDANHWIYTLRAVSLEPLAIRRRLSAIGND